MSMEQFASNLYVEGAPSGGKRKGKNTVGVSSKKPKTMQTMTRVGQDLNKSDVDSGYASYVADSVPFNPDEFLSQIPLPSSPVKKVTITQTPKGKKKEKVIYHQTMTPTWLEAHASYIDSSHTKTTEQLTFSAGSVRYAALLKVPMIPEGVLQYSASLTVKIVVSPDVTIGTTLDSDISYGVSDGISVVGFVTRDKYTYRSGPPCHGFEGTSRTALTGRGWLNEYSSPKPSDSFYPGRFVITLKLDEHWGSCYTAHDGGLVKTATFNKRLMFNKGLTLEVYKDGASEKVGIKYIEVTILQDA